MNSEYRRCLATLDVQGMRKLWKEEHPELHQPTDDNEILETMHRARTMMGTIPEEARKVSERWLEEREKVREIEAVGYATSANDMGLRRALLDGVSRTIEGALAGGVKTSDAKILRPLILDAREKIKSGRISI